MKQGEGGALRELRDAKPGERFQAYHRAAHGAGSSRALNMLAMVAGVMIVGVGILAVPAPGPGFLIIALGGGLIARQSAGMARLLDRGEVALRQLVRRSALAWRAASLLERVIFAMVVAAGALILGYWVLWWMLKG